MKTELISKVQEVELSIEKTNPPTLIINTVGLASSGSHTNPELNQRHYPRFPDNGIQEFDFRINVPDGDTTGDVTEHTLELKWKDFPNELKGVCVYAKNNSAQVLLTDFQTEPSGKK